MKPILLCLAFAAALALPAPADTITGTEAVSYAGVIEGSIEAWGVFSFAGPNFSITGSGWACGPGEYLNPGPFFIWFPVSNGCGPDPWDPMDGTAIVNGINYGTDFSFLGYLSSDTSGTITQDQYDNGGSSASPGTMVVNLQGCANEDILPGGACRGPYLFSLQFNVDGINTTTWMKNGLFPSVTFQTTPEPASMALFAIGLLALGRFGHAKRRRSEKSPQRLRRLKN